MASNSIALPDGSHFTASVWEGEWVGSLTVTQKDPVAGLLLQQFGAYGATLEKVLDDLRGQCCEWMKAGEAARG